VDGVTTRYVYDEQGRLIGEYDQSGNLIQETVWLDDLPIATLRPTGTGSPTPIAIYYVHADHLGSPRAITRPSDDQIVWRWDNDDPFGNSPANENPSGQGDFRYDLRFPGQQYDSETGTHYNYFRDYDSSIGRFLQSDPIGLAGGLSTYAYSDAQPLKKVDFYGLAACCAEKECRMQCISMVLFDKVVCNRFERCPGDRWKWVGQETLWAPSRPFTIYGEMSCSSYEKWKGRPRPIVPGLPAPEPPIDPPISF